MKEYLITYQKNGETKTIPINAPSKKLAREFFYSFFCKSCVTIISIEKSSKERKDQLVKR